MLSENKCILFQRLIKISLHQYPQCIKTEAELQKINLHDISGNAMSVHYSEIIKKEIYGLSILLIQTRI